MLVNGAILMDIILYAEKHMSLYNISIKNVFGVKNNKFNAIKIWIN